MYRLWLCIGQESRRREHQEMSISLSVLTDGVHWGVRASGPQALSSEER
jgi:hypothetical protein